jgi:hypothetical protein
MDLHSCGACDGGWDARFQDGRGGEFRFLGAGNLILVLRSALGVGSYVLQLGVFLYVVGSSNDESQGRNCRRTECNEFLKGDAVAVVTGGGAGLASGG